MSLRMYTETATGKTIAPSVRTYASPHTVPRQSMCVLKKLGMGAIVESSPSAMILTCFASMYAISDDGSIKTVPTMNAIELSGRLVLGELEGTRTLVVMLDPSVQEIAVS